MPTFCPGFRYLPWGLLMSRETALQTETTQLNILQIFKLLLRLWWVIALCIALTVGAAYGLSEYVITPQYTATTLYYVNNQSFAEDNRLSGSDLDASRSLAETYMVILSTHQTLDAVLRRQELAMTTEEAARMIRVGAVEKTEIFRVIVTGEDPETVGKLARGIEEVFPERVRQIISGSSVTVAQPSAMPTRPSTPNLTRNLISGGLSGMVLGISLVLLVGLFDVSIRREEDIARAGEVPVLAKVPELGKGRKKKDTGIKITPEAWEAYKTLRTKLEYTTLSHTETGSVIGICSARAGEGKSSTAVNLAYVMNQRGSRVLLMDCDLRRPTIQGKLRLPAHVGLSEYLSNQASPEEITQLCNLRSGELTVISAGRVPPNPGELLSSRRMEKLMTQLREEYDYIIVDLPPVGEVSDGLTVSRYTDGTVMVVRRKHCNVLDLRAALAAFASVEKRILGVVFNCAGE